MKIKSCLTFALLLLVAGCVKAETKMDDQKYEVAVNPFASNWFVQAGIDMTMQNPCGKKFRHTFPNGWTFGVDVAAGKWFSPALGLRARVNWENGIKWFENKNANWLAPLYQPGVNMDRGGYISGAGDVMLDVHNLFCGYQSDRFWNLQAFVRAGILYNFGVSKGSPLVGFGVGNTLRLSDRCKLYADMAYQMVSSGHGGMPTGTGAKSNGFLDVNAGVQVSLGQSTFRHTAQQETTETNENRVVTNSFWQNWYTRVGLDMTILLPYEKPFSQSFKKGRTFGFDAAVGKWFTPEIGLRIGANWENGFPLFENKKLEWLAPAGPNGINMDKGGCFLAFLDVPVSLTNIFMGYDAQRRWDGLVYARTGLITNLAISSASPLLGCGLGTTYKLQKRLSLYADLGFQVTTSEFFGDVACTGMEVPTGFNCFFNLNVGLQIALGKAPYNTFRREKDRHNH